MLGPRGGTESSTSVLYLLGGSAASVTGWCEEHLDVLRSGPVERRAILFDVDEAADLSGLTFDEVWAIGDLIPAGGVAQYVVEFLAARSIDVVHAAGTRLGVDLIPTLRYAFGNVGFAVSLPSGTGASVFSRYVACRYFNLIHEFLVEDHETAALLRTLSVPATSILIAPDRTPSAGAVPSITLTEPITYRNILIAAGWQQP